MLLSSITFFVYFSCRSSIFIVKCQKPVRPQFWWKFSAQNCKSISKEVSAVAILLKVFRVVQGIAYLCILDRYHVVL